MRLLRHTTALMAGLLLSGVALAQENSHSPYQDHVENPGIFAMVGDLVIARPLLLGVTAIGAAAFVVSLPFTLAGGNVTEAGQELVLRPGTETFVRCLGCTKSGYGRSQQDENL